MKPFFPAVSARSLAFLFAVISLVAVAACGSQDDDAPLIFAAASLADVLSEAAEAYEAETGRIVEFNFGGSTALANQVARLNAPADGVILAGDGPLQLLVDRGLVDRGGVSVIARNSLVVVSAGDLVFGSLAELSSAGARVAIADSDLAPAGQYAKEALISASVWDELSGQIIPTLDVRAALAAASSRSAGFAIVYATDALTEPGLHVVLAVDVALHQPVVYPAAALTASSQADAVGAFLDFLISAEGQRIFRDYGFTSN